MESGKFAENIAMFVDANAVSKAMNPIKTRRARDPLADTLSARGATVEYAECYRRGRPQLDAAPLLKAWARNELHAITGSSSEGLRNLYDLVGKPGQSWLKKTPLFVPHPRIEQAARELGLATRGLNAQGDEGLVQGLEQWSAVHA